MKNTLSNPTVLVTLMALISLCMLVAGIAFAQSVPQTPASGKVLGLAFQSVSVANLERSIKYYKMLGFTVVGDANPPWVKDDVANRLYKTPGAMSRTATLSMPTSASGKPFILYLREYKDFDRHSRADFPARAPSSCHFGVLVPDADTLWTQLKEAGLLRALSWDAKLVRMPGQNSGGIAYVMDPDGFNIEIIGVRLPPAAGPQKSPQDHPSLHHLGLAVLDSAKSESFYGGLLGAKFPDTLPEWVGGDMYDAAVGGHGYIIRLINGAFPEAAATSSEMRFELVEYQKPTRQDVADYSISDVAVSSVGFQVEGLDALYSRLKAAGVTAWSGGGIVKKTDGTRSLVVRDPDVHAFVELFEKSGK
jgi:catechol 2,3-dioxygenase-like lactoylglutathione lyase family enzyme